MLRLVASITVCTAGVAHAQSPSETPATIEREPIAWQTRVGAGYRASTSHGLLALDLIARPWSRVALQLTLAPIHETGVLGVAAVPTVEVALFPGDRWTPFARIGYELARMRFGDVVGYGHGFVHEAGYEFRWHHVGIQLALGARATQPTSARDGMLTVTRSGTFEPTASFALRYYH